MKTKLFNALSLAVIMAMLVTSLALADNVQNDVAVNFPGGVTLTEGDPSSSATVGYYVHALPNDGDPNCNLDGGVEKLTINISPPSGVSADPTSVTFTACNQYKYVTFTAATGAQSGEATVSITYNNTGAGTYNLSPAKFNIAVTTPPPPPPSDTTAPVITKTITGTVGANGWYTSDVTVDWTVSDPESAFTTIGCVDTTIDSDTAGSLQSCSATSAGGTSSDSVTIKRDATAPTISGSASPAANGDGWNNSGVNVSFSCSDGMSGIASCTSDQTLSDEGMDKSVNGTAVDNAGNSASTKVSGIDIDLTAPTISGSASPVANANGWNNSDVTVAFICGDGLSGVKSCGPDQTLSSEGAGQSASGTAVDYADNSASGTVSGINIDTTAPTVSASASPAANVYGWNNSAVTVSFSGTDALSGIDACDGSVVLGSEGAGQSASGSCADKAGNSASATASGINIDLTAPSVALVGGPVNGSTYYFGFVPATPTCSASDALSGLDGFCSVSGYGIAIGSYTVTASATDKAGNSASASTSYTVLGWTPLGFYQPVDMGKLNVAKNGSTVPLKFEVFAGPTELTDVTFIKQTFVQTLTCGTSMGTDEIETYATGSTSLRYDWNSGQFIFNWQTPKKAGNCYRVTLTLQDGSKIEADFKLK